MPISTHEAHTGTGHFPPRWLATLKRGKNPLFLLLRGGILEKEPPPMSTD